MSVATTKERSYTPAQREAILSPWHTLLEAGAGSGKTTTLVGKILHALGAEVVKGEHAAEPCELGQLAAITFTTAAAADLRRSLRSRLREHAAVDPERRWRRLVYEVDRARIGTIHSFCGQVLREFAAREGMDAGFAVLDAGEAADLREECARSRLYAALGAGDALASELVFQLTPNGAVRAIRDAMEKGDAARQAYERWCAPDGSPRTAEIRTSIETMGGTWRAHDDAGASLAAAALRIAMEARAHFDERLDAQGVLDYDALVYRTRDLLRRSPDALAALRGRLRWLFIDEFQDTDPAQRDIAYLICGVEDALAARRSKSSAPAGCPSLCIVGDPKQSIYGFRRADVTLWSGVARDFAELGARTIALDVNFRSRAPLLGLVNGTFGALMPHAGDASAPDYEVRYRPLAAKRDFGGDDSLVELLELPADGKAEERRREEARRIARRLRAMVDGGEGVVWDGEGDRRAARWRDVALLFRASGDVRLYEAELRRLGVPCYVAAGDGFYATREVRDVRLLLAALADPHDDVAWVGLLRSPWVGLTDDALLRLRTARRGVPLSRTLDVELPGGDGEALAFARRWLGELALLRDRVPCAALIERALERSGYAAALLYRQGGDVALANVRKLVRMADGRPEESLAAFVAHLEERGESSAKEGEAALHTAGEDVVLLTTIHGAKGLEWPVVFLCDLDREMPGGTNVPDLFFDVAEGIAIACEDGGAEDESQRASGAHECLRGRARLRDGAEEKRVWYVASTRARDRVVLCARRPAAEEKKVEEGKTPKPTPARWLLGGVLVDGEALSYSCDGKVWRGPVVADVEDVAAAAPVGPPRLDEVSSSAALPPGILRQIAPVPPVSPLFRRSATELMVFTKSRDDHRRSYVLGVRPSPFARNGSGNGKGGAGGDGLAARVTGDIVHTILERSADEIGRDLDALLEREVTSRMGADADGVMPAGMARLRRLIEKTVEHPSVARLFGGEAVERELPFTWLLDVDGEVSVFHGAMDLVARVEGGLEILDFKTHRLAAGEEMATAADYALQRDLYAAALAAIEGAPAAFTLFFPETSGEVRSPVDEATLAEGEARIRETLREMLRAVVGGGDPSARGAAAAAGTR